MESLKLYGGLIRFSIYTSLAIASKMTLDTAPLFIDVDPHDHVVIAARNFYLGWDQEVYIPDPN
jgi:hypothetical protein